MRQRGKGYTSILLKLLSMVSTSASTLTALFYFLLKTFIAALLPSDLKNALFARI